MNISRVYKCSLAIGLLAGPASPAGAAAAGERLTACETVTSTEMSAILGKDVVGEPDNGAQKLGKTFCNYFTNSGRDHALTYGRGWNFGKTVALIAPTHHGAATAERPYADIGDAAALLDGSVVMFRVGSDSMTLDLGSVDQARRHAIAQQVVATARSKMQGAPAAVQAQDTGQTDHATHPMQELFGRVLKQMGKSTQ